MRRRDFLSGLTGVAIAQFLTGCADNSNGFRVELLRGMLPGQLLNRFQSSRQLSAKLQILPLGRTQEAFQHLQNWYFRDRQPVQKNLWSRVRELPIVGEPPRQVADLVNLPDSWLQAAIQQKLIQPVDVSSLKNWSKLDAKWQELVTRDDNGFVAKHGNSSQGNSTSAKVWGAPFRWGTTVIVYRRDIFQQKGWKPPQDWSDLWREELRDRISVLDHSRETIGLVLKKLGKSYNTPTENLNSIPNLKSELQQLHQQTKFYSSDRYLEPLMIGDTYMAVGWSNEVIPLILRDPRLAAIIPLSGTALWADLWVIPTPKNQPTPDRNNIRSQWIDFFWDEKNAQQITLHAQANTPIPTQISTNQIQSQIANLLVISSEVINKSELILPLNDKVNQHYLEIFNQMKIGNRE